MSKKIADKFVSEFFNCLKTQSDKLRTFYDQHAEKFVVSSTSETRYAGQADIHQFKFLSAYASSGNITIHASGDVRTPDTTLTSFSQTFYLHRISPEKKQYCIQNESLHFFPPQFIPPKLEILSPPTTATITQPSPSPYLTLPSHKNHPQLKNDPEPHLSTNIVSHVHQIQTLYQHQSPNSPLSTLQYDSDKLDHHQTIYTTHHIKLSPSQPRQNEQACLPLPSTLPKRFGYESSRRSHVGMIKMDKVLKVLNSPLLLAGARAFSALINGLYFPIVYDAKNKTANEWIAFFLFAVPLVVQFVFANSLILHAVSAAWALISVVIVCVAIYRHRPSFNRSAFPAQMEAAIPQVNSLIRTIVSWPSLLSILTYNYLGFTEGIFSISYNGVKMKHYSIALYTGILGFSTSSRYLSGNVSQEWSWNHVWNQYFALIISGALRVVLSIFLGLSTPDSLHNPLHNLFFTILFVRLVSSLFLYFRKHHTLLPLFLSLLLLILRSAVVSLSFAGKSEIIALFAGLPPPFNNIPAACYNIIGYVFLFLFYSSLSDIKVALTRLFSSPFKIISEKAKVKAGVLFSTFFYLLLGLVVLYLPTVIALIMLLLKVPGALDVFRADEKTVNFGFVMNSISFVSLAVFGLQLFVTISSSLLNSPPYPYLTQLPISKGRTAAFTAGYVLTAGLVFLRRFFIIIPPFAQFLIPLGVLFLACSNLLSIPFEKGLKEIKNQTDSVGKDLNKQMNKLSSKLK
ncbi:hypothetical protein BLNAU_9727 [Blattamonas nauphoetae]|uniref:NTF2 domain-containing protein n=1 Tax=Blattamonas nauphoetae TaxID=2049346 RepID=A0ABQ9XV32_9EUKA|nr:hypothetical protein BLNAU_9727 [Blattamonas nauphoetae]